MKKVLSKFLANHPRMLALVAGLTTFLVATPSFAAAEIEMPTAPQVDLSAPLQWFFDFAVSIFSGNIGIIISVAIGIAAIFGAINLVKRFGKSAVKG